MKKILFLLVLFFPIGLFAQYTDNFEDGDISDWYQSEVGRFAASATSPINGSYSLKHVYDQTVTANYTDTICHSLSGVNVNNGLTEWQFQVKYDNTNPSGSNKWNFVLMSNQNITENPFSNLNGYIIGVNLGSTTDDVIKIWKITNGTSAAIVTTSYVWTINTAIGLKITRTDAGDWEVFMDSDGGFDNLITIGTGTSNTFTNASYFGAIYHYTMANDMKLWIDDISIIGTEGNNDNSTITAGTDTEPTSISSIINNADGFQVFDIILSDLGTSDGLPTIINSLSFTQGSTNQVTNWTNAIAGAKLFGPDLIDGIEGIITSNNISFTQDNIISIADGETETYKLKIWLKTDLQNISDNDNFNFKISSADIITDINGSSFANMSVETGDIFIDIVATKLNFLNIPTVVALNEDFGITVTASDINGNIDENYNDVVTLTENGEGILTSTIGLTQNLITGNYNWSDLQYNTLGVFQIEASSSGFSNILSQNISCSNYIYYLNDDFEDGDILGWDEKYTGNWAASDIDPLNGTFSLKQVFDATEELKDVISHQLVNVNLSDSIIWKFQIKYNNTDPSSTNNWSVFIFADADNSQMFSGGVINGYLIGVNFTGSDDIIKLWKITNGTPTEIINTGIDWKTLDKTTAKGFVITRSSTGLWNLEIDIEGGFNNLTNFGTVTDISHLNANYFGLYYRYTASLDKNFWADDIYIGLPIPDIEKPYITSNEVISQNIIILTFNEDMNTESVENVANYLVDNSINNPISAIQNINNLKEIELTFGTNFQTNINYNLTLNNLKDLFENTIDQIVIPFTWENINIVSHEIISKTSIDIHFSKNLDEITGSTLTNYIIDNEIGNPISAEVDVINKSIVHLVFATEFTTNEVYILTVENVTDFYGNIIEPTNYNFIFDFVDFFEDNFEDGDVQGWAEKYTGNWAASDIDPITGTFSLKHVFDATEELKDVISHQIRNINISDSITWQFQIKYNNTDPSSSNNWSVFLYSDADNSQMLSGGSINGYLIGVNFSGTDDLIKLWKITNGTTTEILNTNLDWKTLDNSTPKGFLITRSTSGKWYVKIDSDGGFDNLISYGSVQDDTHLTAEHFGIYYRYTASMDQNFWVDDIYIGPPIPDTNKPYLYSNLITSPNKIILTFNEDLDKNSSENITNYIVNEGIGNPISAVQNINNLREIELSFSNNFQEEIGYNLTINNVKDLSDNIIEETIVPFSWQNISVNSLRFLSSTQIDVKFSKSLDSLTSSTFENYSINNEIGNPISAQIDLTDNSIVHLVFSSPLIINESYVLTVENVEDNFGNIIEITSFDFIFYIVQPYDIVINELMIDVNPSPVALPTNKYIELLNTSNHDIDLTDWTFKIGTNNEIIISNFIINQGEFAIICSEEAENYFTAYGKTLPILTESQLTSTSGKQITLKEANNQIIEQITYSTVWYNNPNKDDGGWSIERIDPLNICSQESNWRASENYIGGTPSMTNSVYTTNPDIKPPYIESITLVTSCDIIIDFSETVTNEATNLINYILNNIVTPLFVTIDENDNSIIKLKFIEHFLFSDNTLYIRNISDYCDNQIKDTSITFFYELIYPTAIEPKSSNQLKIYFSEPVSKLSAENISNYEVNSGIGNPIIAIRDVNDTSIIHLQLANNFIENQTYILSTNSITDINGNSMTTSEKEFVYHIPQPFDIVINELMLDVNPIPLGLPESQYVELYNTTNYDIWLSDWVFEAEAQSSRVFPNIYIKANSYALICNQDAETNIKTYGKTVPILGTSDLTQTGKELKIYDNRANLIYHIRYSNLWYNDENKDNGGWALEKIDPANFCESGYNWAASTDISGGTPGRLNSIYKINIDTLMPTLTNIEVVSSNSLLIKFSKNISYESAFETNNYEVNNIGKPININSVDTSYSTFVLFFENEFADKETYTLTVNNIKDDCGNVIVTESKDFKYYLINAEYLWILNNNQIQIKFSEEIAYSSAFIADNYIINNNIGIPNYIVRSVEDPSIIYLQYSNIFTDETDYSIALKNIEDINGNKIKDTAITFTYYIAKVNDIVINEVLFNPYTKSVDFVELYNRSVFPIDMKNINIAKRDELGQIETSYNIATNNFLLYPNNYLVITTDSSNIKQNYYTNGQNFIQLKSIPTYADDAGTVVIIDQVDTIIDEFSYNEDMHFKLLSDKSGVSLERIDYDYPSNDSSNWHSASASVGFATPGLKNSQYRKISDIVPNSDITLQPEVFSPDNDGFDDQLYIFYDFREGGYVATVDIFDKNGRLIRNLVKEELISVDGFWIWDGLDNYDMKVKIGIYAIIIKYFDLDGNVNVIKKSTVVAAKN